MLSNKTYFLFTILLIGILLNACRPVEESPVKDDVKLAQVFNKVLYLSDLDGMISSSDSPADSLMILNAVVEKWVRNNLLMHEAERNIPKDLNIDQLVRDYRASLIRHSYEKRMVEALLDSVVTQTELESYYTNHKDQYKLTSPIVRCHFIKIPKEQGDYDSIKELWGSKKEEDYKNLLEYCDQYAEVYMLENDAWYNLNDLALQLPKGKVTASNVKMDKEFNLSDDTHYYFLKILDTESKGNIAPLAYIQDQASKVILHKRKLKLLDEKKEEFYERETQRNNVQVFIN